MGRSRLVDQTPNPTAYRGFPTTNHSRANVVAILVLIGMSALLTAALDVPKVRSDGFAYYIWLQTLVRDHSLDIAPVARQYARFLTYQVIVDPRTGRIVTQFAFGTAVLWAPFYAVSLLLDHVRGLGLHARDAAFIAIQGDTFLHSLAVSFGTWVYSTVALVLSFLMARRLVDVKTAAFVILAAFVGTPLYYYTAIEPTMSHGVATFAITLPIWLVTRTNVLPIQRWVDCSLDSPDKKSWLKHVVDTRFAHPRYWFIVGLTLGLAGTIRWQLILLSIPIGLGLLYRGRLPDLLACAAGAAVVFVTVPLSWWYLFGSPTPAAVGTVRDWVPDGWQDVLFAPASGIFVWSPITLLGVVGIVGLAVTGPRRTGILLLMFLALEVVVNAVAGDPSAGSSFGMRRMTEAFPVFVIGLAWLLQRVAHSRTTVRGIVYGATLVCAAFTMLLFFTYIRALINPQTGTVIDAIIVWLPPHTLASFNAVRSIHVFGFGSY